MTCDYCDTQNNLTPRLSFTATTIMNPSSLRTPRKRALSDGPDVQSVRKKNKNVNDPSDHTAISEMAMEMIDSKTWNVLVSESLMGYRRF